MAAPALKPATYDDVLNAPSNVVAELIDDTHPLPRTVHARSASAVDRTVKLPVYGAQGVTHVWFVDTDSKRLEVLRLDGRTYPIVGSDADDARVTAEPFEGFTLDLSDLWSR